MSKYYLFQDTKKCIGCHSCEVACKSSKDLPVGPKLCEIITIGPTFVGGLPKAAYTFMPCFHCEDPWCVAACPTGAMQRREKDGIVFLDPTLCVGCKTCMSACPWGAPQWNPETGKAVKCDYCIDRIDRGQQPACVTVCTTHCLHFAPAEAAPRIRRERYAKAMTSLE
ncbi:MAG: 4Fe-4S dicluster domain-containing protein [Deltaproteobacteria bacterium]|nr:4Fe-4S dicluster domain-containing protein [Deltaproteobacteria bacterium]MBW2048059.1 4Fe-4S dicluster domain-containing protein [Deltaproteobacteria bacterium]MBW2110443.1 4Fe-4S dicluster domain-containing protein [Deltaproteobacteria bacterium]MBW2352606.1 4Fe-4S dicluster domain-containing protein [Deltaproteobacteria bacterium]HDZ90097.1 4Fe-4S dicluster domain-containing protein [Deltaproteobacteria bacterium]